MARNECRRRLRARAPSVSLDEAAELTDDTIDLSAEAEKAELRALVSSALAGLNPGDREIIELNLRRDLAGRDLADALGVRPNQAHALASRARSQFETSLGALLVARTGRESCADLAAILAGWDGQLNVLLRKRINRHIERCPQCRARKQRELSPAMLLGMLPVALLPTSLRDQLLGLISDFSPGPSVYRASVIHRAGPFGQSGFPRPLDPPHVAHGPVVHAATVGAGAAAVAVIAAGILYATHGKPHAPHPPGPVAIGAVQRARLDAISPARDGCSQAFRRRRCPAGAWHPPSWPWGGGNRAGSRLGVRAGARSVTAAGQPVAGAARAIVAGPGGGHPGLVNHDRDSAAGRDRFVHADRARRARLRDPGPEPGPARPDHQPGRPLAVGGGEYHRPRDDGEPAVDVQDADRKSRWADDHRQSLRAARLTGSAHP